MMIADRCLFDDRQGISHGLTSRIPTRESSKVLPSGYIPREWDVICNSSSKETQEHIGNRRFNLCVENYVETYKNAKSRVEKSAVISDIVGSIRDSSTTGVGFVRFDMKMERWYEVADKIARDKVGKRLRAHNSNQKKTSSPSEQVTQSPTDNNTRRGDVHPRVPADEPSSHSAHPMRPDQPARSNDSSASTVPKSHESTSPIDDMMIQSTHTTKQDDRMKSNDSSDDSLSDNTLIAWFEADTKGTN